MPLIRSMTLNDLEEVLNWEPILFGLSAWSRSDYEEDMMDNPFSYYFIYEINGKMAGYMGVLYAYENAEILTIGTLPEFRRQGVARELLQYAFALAKQKGCLVMSLEVRQSNRAAIALYQSEGFKRVAVRKNYYADHENADLMIKEMGDMDDFNLSD